MANTLTISISANYTGNGLTTANTVNGQAVSISTNAAPEGVNSYSVPTTAAAIPLGGISTPRYLFIQNLDASNYMEVYTGSGGTLFAELLPGDAMLIPLDPSITAPYWKAHTSAVNVNYRVFGT
jgi:hypothetical protein